MKSSLRVIAVHVEEPGPGEFQWVLTERHGPKWVELERAAASVDSYQVAMAQGLVALESMATDLAIGPREEGEQPSEEEPAPARKPGSLFGFGPAR